MPEGTGEIQKKIPGGIPEGTLGGFPQGVPSRISTGYFPGIPFGGITLGFLQSMLLDIRPGISAEYSPGVPSAATFRSLFLWDFTRLFCCGYLQKESPSGNFLKFPLRISLGIPSEDS